MKAIRTKTLVCVALAACGLATHAGTGTATGTPLVVTAVVLSTCAAVSAPVTFGNYQTTGSAVNQTGSITVTCTPDVTGYDVLLDKGAGTGASVSQRKMTFLTNTLNYNLYRDLGATQIWGETVGTDTVHQTGSSGTHPIFGLIASNQAVTPGAYSDTVAVTINFVTP
ncbi:MAG: spore coat U domain-containing protein [Ramlibacter sp.]|nr:spore coat U domain-containing protein [Ramlibacter sp.]